MKCTDTRLVFVVLVFGGLISCVAHAQAGGIEQTLQDLAKELNKSVPIQVDHEKKLEVVVAFQDTLIFKYKFTDETVIDDPRFENARYLSALRSSLISSMCGNPGTVELFRQGAKYNYVMIRRNGKKVVDFTLDRAACSQYRG